MRLGLIFHKWKPPLICVYICLSLEFNRFIIITLIVRMATKFFGLISNQKVPIISMTIPLE